MVKVLVVPRVDGWYRARAPQTVFLVWDGEQAGAGGLGYVHPPGCQVHWDGKGSKFRCPCHGGVYDATGKVLEGPPPRPLDTLEARIDTARRHGAGAAVIGRLIDWLDERTGLRTHSRGPARRAAAAGHRLVLHARQRAARAPRRPAPDRRLPHALLRADPGSRLRQRSLHQQHHGGPDRPRPASLRRQLHRRCRGAAHAAGDWVRLVQARRAS